jgi:hypothetical protein
LSVARVVSCIVLGVLCGALNPSLGVGQHASAALGAPSFRPVDLGSGAANVRSIAYDGAMWWAAGWQFDAEGIKRPRVWQSSDALSWRALGVAPRTGYGEISELYSIAAGPSGVAAIGAATGGAHGNPRTVSWVVTDGVLTEVPASFELYNGVRQISVRSMVTAKNDATGFVIFGSRVNRNGVSGATSWTSADATDFAIHDNDGALSSGPGEFVLGLDVAAMETSEAGYVAVGERMRIVPGSVDVDAIAWQSVDGKNWARWTPRGLILDGRFDQRAQRVAVDPSSGKVVIAGTQTDPKRSRFVVWSRQSNNGRWRRQLLPDTVVPSSADPLSNATCLTVNATVTVLCARSGDRLVAVRTTDGVTWRPVALPTGLPSGQRATLTVAVANGLTLIGATGPMGGGLWIAPAS